jgi:hypothetical protein
MVSDAVREHEAVALLVAREIRALAAASIKFSSETRFVCKNTVSALVNCGDATPARHCWAQQITPIFFI